MTREEQIKKAAHDFSWGWCDDKAHPLNDGFIEGAKWADFHPHWIPVEEQLPPPYCSNGSISDFVLTYNGYDVVKGYYDFMQNNWHNENYKVMEFDVTHWMPIVPPRKEE